MADNQDNRGFRLGLGLQYGLPVEFGLGEGFHLVGQPHGNLYRQKFAGEGFLFGLEDLRSRNIQTLFDNLLNCHLSRLDLEEEALKERRLLCQR